MCSRRRPATRGRGCRNYPSRTNRCSRRGRHNGVPWFEVLAAGPAAELYRWASGVQARAPGCREPHSAALHAPVRMVEASPAPKPGAIGTGQRRLVKKQGVSWCRSSFLYERHAQQSASADSLRSAALAAELQAVGRHHFPREENHNK
jgi:hypothetical protein